MWSITLQLMKKNKGMLIPAGVAIIVGTAFIAGTYLFGNAMNAVLYGDDAPLSGSDDTSMVTTFLMSFGVLALLVAALVIANTFQVVVAQRRRTLALLRTVGAQASQLYWSVVFEAVVLGIVASLLGVLVGWGAMELVSLIAPHIKSDVELSVPVIMSWQVVVIPVVFGVVITALASTGAARSATAVTPLEALRPLDISERTTARRGQGIIGSLMLLVGVALAVFGAVALHNKLASGTELSSAFATQTLLAAVLGCALIFLGAVVTATFWMPVAMKGSTALVSRIGPASAIAGANIRKNPRRIAATGTALLIGVTLVSTISTGAATVKQTMTEELNARYAADMTLSGPQWTPALRDEVTAVRGVQASMTGSTAVGTFTDSAGEERHVLLVGVPSIDALKSVLHADLNGTSLAYGQVLLQYLNAGDGTAMNVGKSLTIAVSPSYNGETDGETEAETDGEADTETDSATDADTTDTRDVTFDTETASFRNVSDYATVGFVDQAMFDNGTLPQGEDMTLLRFTDDSTLQNEAVQDIVNIVGESQVDIYGPVVMRMMWDTVVNTLLLMLVGLLAVAVIVALIGVANTLSLSVIERTKESATLRAIGMTKGQLRRSLAMEALVISVTASLAGLLLGTVFGFLGSYMVMSEYAPVKYTVSWWQYGLVLVVAIVAALLASVFPARRATKTSPVEALAEA